MTVRFGKNSENNTNLKKGEYLNTTRVHNLIIVDASGSMTSIYQQALSGMNETIGTIRIAVEKHPEIQQYVSLLFFSTGGEELRYVSMNQPVSLLGMVTSKDYVVCGSTALYDAIGISVTKLMPHVVKGDSVLVTIITDGYENDSIEWDRARLTELIGKLKREDWVFTYIGANQDVVVEAGKVGIKNTMSFAATQEGTELMFRKEREARLRWNGCVNRGEKMAEGRFFDEEESLPVTDNDRVTPAFVDSLQRDEVFVFGSNIRGVHSGNSSLRAVRHFGARMGVAEGMQGRSYAIPTVGLCYEDVGEAVGRFIRFASKHPEMRFLVTRIGCGTAGYTDREMAVLFVGAKHLRNVTLPGRWWNVINNLV